MNDDELRAALARRAASPLSADDRNDVLRAARVEALKPQPRRSVWPRLAGWVAAAAAVLVLGVVALPVLLSPPLVGPSKSHQPAGSSTSAPASAAAAITLHTAESPQDACDDALLTGVLVEDPNWGIAVETAGQPMGVVWPYAYSARRNGVLAELLDGSGAVRAVTGQTVAVGGGIRNESVWYACGEVSVVDAEQSQHPVSGIQIYSAQKLADMIGDPTWVGKSVLAKIEDGEMTPTPCPMPTSGLAHCPYTLNVGAGNQVDVGLRDATSSDGVQYDDGNGYRWVTPLSVPSSGTFAFTVGDDSVEYLGPAALDTNGSALAPSDVLGISSTLPNDGVLVVEGWLVKNWPPPPCAAPPEMLETPRPALDYYCYGTWITPESDSDLADGVRVQNDAYEFFAPSPSEGDHGPTPERSTYLIRNAGCPPAAGCPVWRMVGRLEGDSVYSPNPPVPTPTPNTATLHVSNTSTLTLNVLINDQVVASAPPQQMTDVDPSAYAEPWHVTVTTLDGRELLTLDYRASDVSYHDGGATGVGQRADLSCGRIDVYAGPPMLGPGPPSSFPPGDCEDAPSPSNSLDLTYSTADLGELGFQYPSAWTLNPTLEIQRYGAVLGFVSSETATAQTNCGSDYQPGPLASPCGHTFDLPAGAAIVSVERYTFPGHGMQSVAYDVGRGWEPVDVGGMSGAYSDHYTDSLVSTGQSAAWQFAAPGDTTASYTIVATDNGYPDLAAALDHLISTVTLESLYPTVVPIGQSTAEEIAQSFFVGVHENDTVGESRVNSSLGTDDVSGRSAWQVEISAPITEPQGGATYTSAFKLSIDAETGAVRVVAQG
jgi:hypothetical protein